MTQNFFYLPGRTDAGHEEKNIYKPNAHISTIKCFQVDPMLKYFDGKVISEQQKMPAYFEGREGK